MTPETAQAAMQFLLRVQLTGQEVPAFNSVMVALQDLATKPDELAPDRGKPSPKKSA